MASIDSSPVWRALEEQVEAFFASSGYTTQRNVVLEGRSGGRHEIDVLARKSDGITEFAVLVECKAWNQPIEKDVVSKASYVVQDLGLNKAIIVSLQGWRVGAEQAALELGVDLWDSTDLERHLGQALVASLRTGSATGQRHVLGPEAALDLDSAGRLIARKRTGLVGKEELVWIRLAWIPFYLLELRLSHAEKKVFGKPQVKSRVISNYYEALGGSFRGAHSPQTQLVEIAAVDLVPARVRDRQVMTGITKECAKLGQLTSQQARTRQAAKINALGVPLPFQTVNIDSATEIAFPYYLGLLERRGEQRLIAASAFSGRVVDGISHLLTGHLSFIRDALGPPPVAPPAAETAGETDST